MLIESDPIFWKTSRCRWVPANHTYRQPKICVCACRRDAPVSVVISGRAELTIEGQTIMLEPGDSWLIPAGAEHSYRILEVFTAVEATAPPAQVHGRDEN